MIKFSGKMYEFKNVVVFTQSAYPAGGFRKKEIIGQ
jgi:hypothetical protein